MKVIWLKIIAVLEIIGGILGIAFMFWVLLTNPVNVFTILLAIVATGIYVLSLVAGLLLWQDRSNGRTASIVVQVIALPKIITPAIIFMFSFGFDVWLHYLQTAVSSNVGFEFRFLAFNQFFINAPNAPVGIGVSITSCVFLAILVKHKPGAVSAEALPPAPPVEWSNNTNS